jgi:hypothetical protein
MHYRSARSATKRKQEAPVMIPADTVWAAACAAQRVIGEYLKEPVHTYDDRYNVTATRPANKVLMREIIAGNPNEKDISITDADRAQAAEARQYWQTKLMDVLSGAANSFVSNAVELASRDEFADNDWYGLATVACLPQSYVRGLERDKRNEIKQEAQLGSQHFGRIGDKTSGKLTVLESRYSQQWLTHYVTAKVGNNVILFAYREELEAGKELGFKGTIKAHRDNNITQLNRVKLS